jgi:hypothetical protein
MATQAGVWIDHKQAVVVLMTDEGQEIKKVKSGAQRPAAQPAGSTRSKHKYTPNDFVAEDRLERKADSRLKSFYDEVIKCLQGSEALLILGPGEAKGEFRKQVEAKQVRGLTVELETTDKLTERQLAAKVKEHFAKAPTRKPVAPKRKAKAVAGKRTKKAANRSTR